MNIYVIICTRSNELNLTTGYLNEYFLDANIPTRIVAGAKSIFSGYLDGLKFFENNYHDGFPPTKGDIVILCHDDIRILMGKEDFVEILSNNLSNHKVGFVGVAGTAKLEPNGVWWDTKARAEGNLRGLVWHGESIHTMYWTPFGPYGEAVVMDGVFLAARYETLKELPLDKPENFKGDWDFYDLTYCMRAHEKGLTNKVVPIHILHNSPGKLVGRDSWHMNREAFCKTYKLPIEIKK